MSAELSNSSSSTDQDDVNDKELCSLVPQLETVSSKNTSSLQPSSSLRHDKTEVVTRRDRQSSPASRRSRFIYANHCGR